MNRISEIISQKSRKKKREKKQVNNTSTKMLNFNKSIIILKSINTEKYMEYAAWRGRNNSIIQVLKEPHLKYNHL